MVNNINFCTYYFIKIVLFVNVVVCNGTLKNNDKKMEGFIVGGKDTVIDTFPHSVFLSAFCPVNADTYWICGSSILNQRILLTAAHCVYECKKNFRIDAIAGTTNVNHVNVMRQVRKYVFHGKYNYQTDCSDIAVLFLNGDLPLGNKIKRIIIRPSFPADASGVVAGWGVIGEDNAGTTQLKQVTQVVRNAKQFCKHLRLEPGMMCVNSGSSKDYPAVGDSGSALVTSNLQQIGLVSFKSRNKHIYTIVYTNVSFFFKWINTQSLRLWCNKK